MTVLADTEPYAQYTGTGSRVFFEYGFDRIEGTPVFVTVDGIPVEFTQQSTGVVIEPAPALNARIVIFRLTDITQLSDFQAFEKFHGDKTEDACDKLILLKQEAALWRAACNLYADQQLDRTVIVNDKGDDAEIFLWNLDKTGVFSGEVTTDMPEAGAFVEKPWDFAYFQYGDSSGVLTQQVTSALYPIEIFEEIQIGADLTEGYMRDIDTAPINLVGVPTGGEIIAVRISYGPDTGPVGLVGVPTGGEIILVRITYGPDTDSLNLVGIPLDGEILPGKVDATNPDEELDIGADLSTADCYMVEE